MTIRLWRPAGVDRRGMRGGASSARRHHANRPRPPWQFQPI